MSILLFLNELSCGTPQSAGRVDEVMEDFVALLRYVKRRRSETALVSPVRREDLEFAQGYFVNQWIGARPRNRELWRFIQGMQNRAPYSSVFPPGAAEGAEYSVNGTEARGLGAAHLMDGLLTSLLVDAAWDTSWVGATCDELDDEGEDILSRPVRVRHAATTDHARSHDDWLGQAGMLAFKHGTEIWGARADLYPHLQFLPRVEGDLVDLLPEWVVPVAIRLQTINDMIAEWDPKAPPKHDSWKTDVTQESQTRINKGLCDFIDLDGKPFTFGLHARFRPHQGRIHLRLVPEESRAGPVSPISAGSWESELSDPSLPLPDG